MLLCIHDGLAARLEPIESNTFKLSITHVMKRAAFIRLSRLCIIRCQVHRENEIEGDSISNIYIFFLFFFFHCWNSYFCIEEKRNSSSGSRKSHRTPDTEQTHRTQRPMCVLYCCSNKEEVGTLRSLYTIPEELHHKLQSHRHNNTRLRGGGGERKCIK